MYYEIVLAGVAISLLFVELTGLSPAGLIVPGYLALCLQTPWRIVYTLAVAVAAWGIAKLLGNVMILYGRRRFAVMVLLSFAIDLAVTSLGLLAYDPGMIGVLVPGIMAQELERQGYVFFQTGKKEKQVRFTEAGRAFAGPCLQELYEIEDRAVAAMGEARFREMVEANRAFTEAFAREVQHG